ncbi:MAG: 2-hydroxyacyl-CoA dehydratase family protein [Alphaproteobacteria bacterium]|nr:2-hydroxyacyl-CoA dehydratase family protein [Alphaproteobacteria bacterium]MDP6623608.1 2-hydroxyacyl-CoA dehydratase family protein [Alphaproteobacteria bacterium]
MSQQETAANAAIVGRGFRDGARLFRDWFADLSRSAEEQGQAAYVFVIGSMNEILKTFDLPIVFPEVNALQTAIRRVSGDYLNEAEDYGYSPDVCGYVKADVALQLRGGDHPMGTIPKPTIGIATNGCNTYIKWAEIWERFYDIPIFTFDIPGTRAAGTQSQPGDDDFAYEQRYVAGQVRELIALCEKVSGRKFDVDRFREHLGHANVLSRAYKQVLELNRNRPAVFNALTDGTVYLGVANSFRGSPEGAAYFEDLLEELRYKVANGIGVIGPGGDKENAAPRPLDEQYRLALIGAPCYPIFRRFNDLFQNWGGVFVASTYTWYATGGAPIGFQYDLADPIESYAEGVLLMGRQAMDSMFHQVLDIETRAGEFALDGIVYHPIKSCRTVSTGLADRRHYAAEQLGLSTLYMESDLMDPRVVSEAQMRTRVDAFFEGLSSRRRGH